MANNALESSFLLELFDVPDHRIIHGNAFPIGVRLKETAPSKDITSILKELDLLAKTGIFNDLLRKHGALLFRNLPIQQAADFASFTQTFHFPHLHREVGLAGLRTTINDFVKTANEEPPNVKFYFHNEYGRSAHFPGILFFYAQKVPSQGGRTPLLSSVELWERVLGELEGFGEKLAEKGVVGRQYFPAKEDPEAKTIGWNWKDSYGFDILPTDSLEIQHSKVEKTIRENLQAEAQWQPNGGLLVVQTLPAVRRVASTGKASFFNGLMGVYGRSRDNGALEPPHKGKDGKYHIPSTFGDGEEIPFEVLERVLEIADEIGFLTPWEEGDVALIDNFTVAHARSPWVGERSLLASLWDGHEKFVPF